jgi:50S ribosomal subunit-associated GTPase HflX
MKWSKDFAALDIPTATPRLLVFNKFDLLSRTELPTKISSTMEADMQSSAEWVISLKTQYGLDPFVSGLTDFLKQRWV